MRPKWHYELGFCCTYICDDTPMDVSNQDDDDDEACI